MDCEDESGLTRAEFVNAVTQRLKDDLALQKALIKDFDRIQESEAKK